ncbi:MAG: PorT family protein [Muribaculaceae bacterium]|nr:PorT family protein [Muribaculaceae bacterium]
MKIRKSLILIMLMLVAAMASAASARDLNDKLQNRPYADLRKWHLGFSIGTYTGGLNFTHNGFITDDGAQWRLEQPDYQPGFSVNGLVDLRLNNYFSLRFSPGMYFGSYDLKMADYNNPENTERQNIKTAMVVMPFDLKYAAMRYRNARPYVIGGVMPAFDVSKRRSDFIKLKSSDVYLSVGFGCDFYLPYFKFIPEVKFCFGLSDLLVRDRPDLEDNPAAQVFTKSLSKITSKMIVFTFYFE